jgi:hypothetical protein
MAAPGNDETMGFLDGDNLSLGGGGGGSIVFNPIEPTPVEPTPIGIIPDEPIQSDTPNAPVIADYLVNYEIVFASNFQNEVGDLLKLKYEIVSGENIISTDNITLADYNTDAKNILKSNLTNSTLRIYVEGTLPSNYKILKIFYANRQVAEKNSTDVSKWTIGDKFISIPATELLTGGFAVSVVMEKTILAEQPIVSITSTKYDYNVKDSDLDTIVNIPFNSSNADFVDFYFKSDGKIRVPATNGFIDLSFKKDFAGVYGSKKLIVVPYSDAYGTGNKTEIIVNFNSVNDFPSLTQIIFADAIDVPSFSDLNLEYDVEWNSFAVSSVDIDLVAKDKSRIQLFKSLPANGKIKINLKDLSTKFTNWNGSDNVTLILKPYNRSGAVELVGNEYEIKTTLLLSSIRLDEDIIKKTLFDAFVENLKFTEPEKESKYLTHLANFGNDEQIIVSSWEEDNFTLSDKTTDELGNTVVTKEVESLILKLYSPLPANITENSTLWITKLLTNPLIETVVLSQQDGINCPPIKGPNFSVDVDFVVGKSTGYESLDDLILSSSVSASSNLIAEYLSSSLVNTDDLNIQYVNDSEYIWDNFVHFSSAKERVDNFVYKVQLIEVYDAAISSSLHYSGSIAEITAGSGSATGSLAALKERERQSIKKEQLIQGFDGFEKFLYTSSSMSWPHNGNVRLSSTNVVVESWYTDIIELAESFDINNSNYVLNNIPQYIVNNTENQSLLLFFSMIGQHFDNIYYYTKSIEKSRGLGYKSTNGISDKLLFDVLKSFNWDAKNLSADSQLWNYVFGMDSDGNQQYKPTYDKNGRLVPSNPAKKRTYEIWRRIVNNLPYLLKHKGTRRGVYAIMACYGIPSSNLSILEFGGPEVTDNTKSKFEFDNITTAIKFYGQNSGSIKLEWKNTERNRKPDTIECFVKPAYSDNFNIISGSGWGVNLIGSTDSKYGKVVFNYSGSYEITSSLLPIFNDGFFGIEVSRNSGSVSSSFELNVRQSDKERTIFQQSVTASILNVSASWDGGNYIYIGSGSNGYVGSLDEFRLWSTPLDKERFYEHVSFPEMINGNHVSSSTDDLFFRLDFEYPKNLALSSSLLNVDTNIYFSSSLYRNDLESGSVINGTLIFSENPSASYSASAIDFPSVVTYPYQFEAIDRTVVLEIPDAGSTRYSTNKVRFESQTDFNGNDVSGGVDLSVKNRATKKSFDQAPTDSNRVGLFFSPTKELNIDIAKSLGGLNLDNYIGDPSDRYRSNYKRLDELRNYYFKRFDNRDIYAYINLIKLYEKSMFEDIKKMLPARVKATTGLLIEPHILERSKIAQKKPTGDEYQQDVTIHYEDTTALTVENLQYEVTINSDLSENLVGENNQYQSTINADLSENLIANSYQYDGLIENTDTTITNAESYQQEVNIDAGLDEPTITTEIELGIETYGQTAYETIGFGIYAQNGNAIRTYFDKDNRRVTERIRVQLITEEKERIVTKFAITASANGLGDPRGGYVSDIQTYTETKLNIQPFSGSIVPIVKNNIIEVKPVDGYLPTHYRNTSDLTRGLQNSFFKGSKNTAATTLDGSPPFETFVSNPNTLTVNRTGRNTSEPILEVD